MTPTTTAVSKSTMTALSSAPSSLNSDPVLTIEWAMLDKGKYYPLSMMSNFSVRCILYPLSVIRTRLQVQSQNDLYTGTLDAYKKMVAREGYRSLYRGFWVSAFQVASGIGYVSTYEGVRHLCETYNITNNSTLKSFAGGTAASMVGQTINVPFDVISQHLMILGISKNSKNSNNVQHCGNNELGIEIKGRSNYQIVKDITRTIYIQDGFRGFYRGYTASLCTYVPSSASWWTFYDLFQRVYGLVTPEQCPHMALQCAAAMSAGVASSTLTNPLDLVRTRVQVNRTSIPDTVRTLWRTEKLNIFRKGLTARMLSSVIYSVAIIFGYETVKRWSVHEEYKNRVKW